jgi:hypothetical protein
VRRALRVLGALWSLFGWGILLAGGYWLGVQDGYARGARDIARLMIEMRQGSFETPETWDRGDI